jgi:hypothetical protein
MAHRRGGGQWPARFSNALREIAPALLFQWSGFLTRSIVMMDENESMLKWFAYDHLPEQLKPVSARFRELALNICEYIPPGRERAVALRKLLESKDAAVRAVVHPGG